VLTGIVHILMTGAMAYASVTLALAVYDLALDALVRCGHKRE
jgi:hypothetical protein